MKDKEIYSDKFTRGSRTYFFDINESGTGDMYLKISESKKTENGFEHYRLMIFEEDIDKFSETFLKAVREFRKLKQPETAPKAYSVEKVRETHKNAYSPWTPADDETLELLFCEAKKIKQLDQLFGRNEGAINSRIKKLELKEKYGK